jgi:replication initiation and membrane attachment protein DnaB
MCDTHYFHLTHENSKDHIKKCSLYKKNLLNDEYTLGVFRKVLLDEIGIDYKKTDELCEAVIMYLTNYKITWEQIQQLRNKNR